jgi:hypothetical protein
MPNPQRPSPRTLAIVALAAIAVAAVAGSFYLVRTRNVPTPPTVVRSATTNSMASSPGGSVTPGATTALSGWLITSQNLRKLIAADPALAAQVFDSTRTVLLAANAQGDVPSGWRTVLGMHYTSLSECTAHCSHFAGRSSAPQQHAIALYDDEDWARTPPGEQQNPCASMAHFVHIADRTNVSTIVAPDQNLADPGVITSYQGGETQNWQTFLRLGLASCAAASGATGYHIMSQAFESHWCGNKAGECGGSESDFVNFVTEAALQARARNPDIRLTIGLGANPRYEVTPAELYQDASDVNSMVEGSWMNLVGPRSAAITVPFLLSVVDGAPVTTHTSILFAGNGGTLSTTQPATGQPTALSLAQKGTSETFVSPQTLPGGSVLSPGAYEFQYWTGTGSGFATLALSFGYCSDSACNERTSVTNSGQRWDAVIGPNSRGAASPGGALTTTASTQLPPGGSYHLFWGIQVVSPGTFDLEFGSGAAATNLATPVLFDRTADGRVALAPWPNPAGQMPAASAPTTPNAVPTPTPFRHHRRRFVP